MRPKDRFGQIIIVAVAVFFTVFSTGYHSTVSAQMRPLGAMQVAEPMLLGVSLDYAPVSLKAIKIDPQNSFKFDFLIDPGDSGLSGFKLEDDSTRLIKYFMASLAIPETDLWVNLSPYDEDRIIPSTFGQTEMGRDLLAQDFLLKRLTASLLHPDTESGQAFWSRVSRSLNNKDLPADMFHKVWIVPERAKVFETEGAVFVVESRLKVMLEDDYFASGGQRVRERGFMPRDNLAYSAVEAMRDIVLPVIEREVNEGSHFVRLRQIYSAFILAAWYKQKMRYALLNQVYADSQIVGGINHDENQTAHDIWEEYAAVFREGLYDVIREEYDPVSQEVKTRQYVSGGVKFEGGSSDFAILTARDLDSLAGRYFEVAADMAMASRSSNPFIRKLPPSVVYGIGGFIFLAMSGSLVAGINDQNAKVPYAMTKLESLAQINQIENVGERQNQREAENPIEDENQIGNEEIDIVHDSNMESSLNPISYKPVQLSGGISPVTRKVITYTNEDYEAVKAETTRVTQNYLDYWNSPKKLSDIFHSEKNINMSLDAYVQTIIDAYQLFPEFAENGISLESFVGIITATVAKESGFNAKIVHRTSGARGVGQILDLANWLERLGYLSHAANLPEGENLVWSGDFDKDSLNGVYSLYVSIAGMSKNMESPEEFQQIKTLYGNENWPGDEAAMLGLLYLNHYRGPYFKLANKSRALQKLFSLDSSRENYYHPLYLNTRLVLAFMGIINLNKKGGVLEVNEIAQMDPRSMIELLENMEVISGDGFSVLLNSGDLVPVLGSEIKSSSAAMLATPASENVGGIDLDSSRMMFEIEGRGRVDCVVAPDDPGCLRLNFSPAEIKDMRNNLFEMRPVIIDIRPVMNLPLFMGMDMPNEKNEIFLGKR